MDLIYLHQYFNTPSMAGGTRSYEMARRLVRAGHTVHMITSDRDGSRTTGRGWTRSNEEGIQVHWIRVPYANKSSYPARTRAFLRFAFGAARKACQIGGDLVFATSTPLTIALPGIYAARRLGIPLVFEVRDLWPELPIAMGIIRNPIAKAATRWLERLAYRNSVQIVALSPGMKDGVVAVGVAPERVSVIPNSCDSSLFDVGPEAGREFRGRFSWLGERPLVVYAGALGTANGVASLARIAAATLPREPEVRFLVLGTGREEEQVRDAARKLGVLNRNFFMHQSIPKAEMPACYSAADVVASLLLDLPAMRVSSPNKLFDAFAARKPVLINYEGWLAELLRSSGVGIVVPPNDPDTAAGQLCSFLNDRARRAQAAQAAARLAREDFSRDRLAAALEVVLSRAVNGGISLA